jgi:pseudaminic acid synthase
MKIGTRKIGPGHQPYVIAELSCNHGGRLDKALALIRKAKFAGADACKIQAFTPATITLDHDGPGFTLDAGLWAGRKLYDLYQEAHTPWDWFDDLFGYAKDIGITLFASVFDETSVDFLEQFDCPAYKISSFELVDIPLIEKCAATGKPLILSTGMASPADISAAIKACQGTEFALLHCVSAYPCPVEDASISRIEHMRRIYGCPIGLSDHTLGTDVAVAATALGACIIEKHLTLCREDGGPDAEFSLEPQELSVLVSSVRNVHAALGGGERPASEVPQVSLRRSLYAVKDIAEGETLTKDNVRSIRPGFGLPPAELPSIIGRSAAKTITRGTPLARELIA